MSAAEKRSLRRRLRAARRQVAPEVVHEAGLAVARALVAEAWWGARTVAAFCSLPGEVDMGPVLAAAWSAGLEVALPRVVGAGRALALHRVGPADTLVPGVFGLREPPAGWPEVRREDVGLWLVPALAVDHRGVRLGYGAGYYDRTLAGCAGLRLAALREAERVDTLPVDPWDEPMHGVVTEAGVTWLAERPGPA